MNDLKTNWIKGRDGIYFYEIRTDPAGRTNGIEDFFGEAYGKGKITSLILYRGYHIIACFRKGDWELLPTNERTLEDDLDMINELIYKFN